ncbi:hypothetical protein [Candidatus Deianiraea vastatrix]|uniref:Uncharacterized protein n=1 Tax=Candidatus Deianiraea vastatrix TaxID=2163644 RepID=A0A5B8XCR5_9RICK|nr:hypothetical protein [Candidatus Deianiraea vastatrix]QED23093.1 hypothetical protein Deia_00286 [Candidatus Deianiraea vastatrix]
MKDQVSAQDISLISIHKTNDVISQIAELYQSIEDILSEIEKLPPHQKIKQFKNIDSFLYRVDKDLPNILQIYSGHIYKTNERINKAFTDIILLSIFLAFKEVVDKMDII